MSEKHKKNIFNNYEQKCVKVVGEWKLGLRVLFTHRCNGEQYRKVFKLPKNKLKINEAYIEFVRKLEFAEDANIQKNIKLLETFEKYLAEYVVKRKSKDQYKREKAAFGKLTQFLETVIQKKNIGVFGFSRKNAIKFCDWLKYEGRIDKKNVNAALTNASVNRTVSCFSFFFNKWLFDEGLNSNQMNPFKGISYKEEKRDYREITDEKLALMLNACSHEYQRTFICLCIYGGLRHHEALNLTWADVYLDRPGMRLRSGTTKTKQQRYIPIIPPLLKQLQVQKAEMALCLNKINEKFETSKHSLDKAYIVHRDLISFKPMSVFEKSWTVLREKLPFLKDVRMHDLRHNAATRMHIFGLSHKYVQSILGHASQAMTDRYTHLEEHDIDKAVAGCLGGERNKNK